jgi:hypothetical protein
MTPIDRGEQSTVSTNHRLAIVVMVSAGLLSCGTSPPLARDGPGGRQAYFHASAINGGCQAEHMTSASGQFSKAFATGRPPESASLRVKSVVLTVAIRLSALPPIADDRLRFRTALQHGPTAATRIRGPPIRRAQFQGGSAQTPERHDNLRDSRCTRPEHVRRSGIRFADKDMRQHKNLRRFPVILDHRVIQISPEAL